MSVDRDGDAATQRMHVLDRMRELMDVLPNANQPLSKLMNSEQSAEFAELSSEIRIGSYDHLAESRVQRDATIVSWAIEALDTLRSGKGDLKTKYDEHGDGAALLGLLRKALENDQNYDSKPTDEQTCSVDLSMYLEERKAIVAAQKLAAAPELALWLQLRDKYHVTGPLDPDKLPSPDREKAIWLAKAVAEPLSREMQAASDWAGLRLFMKVSQLEYSTFRDDIITGAGAKDYDYDTSIRKAYAAANGATKHTIDAWAVIEQQMPSDAQKEFAKLKEVGNAAEAGKAASGTAVPSDDLPAPSK